MEKKREESKKITVDFADGWQISNSKIKRKGRATIKKDKRGRWRSQRRNQREQKDGCWPVKEPFHSPFLIIFSFLPSLYVLFNVCLSACPYVCILNPITSWRYRGWEHKCNKLQKTNKLLWYRSFEDIRFFFLNFNRRTLMLQAFWKFYWADFCR